MTKSRAKSDTQEPDQDKHPWQHLGSQRGWTLAPCVAEVAPDPWLSTSCGLWREQPWGRDSMLALLGSWVAWTQPLHVQSPSPCPALPHSCPSPPPFHGPAAAPLLLRRCLTERGPSWHRYWFSSAAGSRHVHSSCSQSAAKGIT